MQSSNLQSAVVSRSADSTAGARPDESAGAAAIPAEAGSLDDWALFLDIDGTLLRLAADPRDAVVDDALRLLIGRLSDRLGGALAFVSGRQLPVIRQMFGPLAQNAAGTYGIEFQVDGVELSSAEDEPPALRDLARQVARMFSGESGLVIERKGMVLSLNTGKRADLLREILPLAKTTLDVLPAGYRIVIGHAGLEMMPEAADKGQAIRRFMALSPFRGRRPIFIGDDQPDERGFAMINALGGLSVHVLPAVETVAHYGIEDVDAVRDWLSDPAFPEVSGFRRLAR